MLHHPHEITASRSGDKTKIAELSAGRRACFSKAEQEKLCIHRICSAGNGLGADCRGKLFVYLLPLGAGRGKWKRLRKKVDERLFAAGKKRRANPGFVCWGKKQKARLSDQSFAKKFGFCAVDTTPDGYELLALSFDGSLPAFTPKAKKQSIEDPGLTIFYDDQCPYIPQRIEKLQAYCAENEIPARFEHMQTLSQAKELPCVFNNWVVFYKRKFVTVNQPDGAGVEKLLKRK